MKPMPAAVNFIVDVENSVKAQQSVGLTRWQKIQNLKEAAKTLNFLTENKLLLYSDLADLDAKEREAAAAFDNAAGSLQTAEKRLADMVKAIKNITAYQQTKPVLFHPHKRRGAAGNQLAVFVRLQFGHVDGIGVSDLERI
jgi:hypothetical protein